jgi:hypothetical protein
MGPVASCLKIGGMCVLYVFDVSILFTPGSVAESPLVRLARLEGAPCTVLYFQRITIRPSIKCIYPRFPLKSRRTAGHTARVSSSYATVCNTKD